MENIRVIIPAAGKGKRLQKLSGDTPKAMFRVNGQPMLEVVLENTDFVRDSDTYIVVGYGKEQILEYFGDRYHYVEQRQQLGTGHAVMECQEFFRDFDGAVLVTFGDMPGKNVPPPRRKRCGLHADDCRKSGAEALGKSHPG